LIKLVRISTLFFRPTRMLHVSLLRLSTFICAFQDLVKS